MKGKSILEVLAVVTFKLAILGWLFAQLPKLGVGHWAQMYLAGIVMIAVPVAILLLTRRDLPAYGLTPQRWRYSLDVGMASYLARLVPWGLGLALLARLGTTYTEPVGALILAVAYVAAIWVLFAVLLKPAPSVEQEQAAGSASGNLLLLAGLLLLPVALAVYLRRSVADVTLTLIYQLVFSGFGEEIYYRGYIQSRINQEFGRTYRIFGVAFGPGLIIAALLFGLSHVLNWFQPFGGQVAFAWWWGIWTCVSGLLYGLLREKTGSVVAPGLAHGVLDAVGEAFGILFPGLLG